MVRIPKNIIRREAYLARLRPFVNKNIIKVLTGQRRVGKSYLLYNVMEEILRDNPEANIIFINFEDFKYRPLTDPEKLYEYLDAKVTEEGMSYIFIDEIQEVKEFESVITSFFIRDNCDIYITGSNSHMLSGELATKLTGRYIEIKVYSLSYGEFLTFHGLEEGREALEKYARYGGLPYLRNLELTDAVAGEYLKSVYSTIVYRDVVARYQIRNTSTLERLAQFIAENIGTIFSAKKISDYLKSQRIAISVSQLQTYTAYLASSFLIHVALRYDLVGKKIFEIGEKYYFGNLGLRNVLTGFRDADRGKIMENLVYNHLLFLGYDVKIGSIDRQEVDFVAIRDNEYLYIQVALRIDSEETARREYGNLLAIGNNYPKYVVTEHGFGGNTYEGIKTLSIREFLMSEI